MGKSAWLSALAVIVAVAACGGLFLSAKLPGYAEATQVTPESEGDATTLGHADFNKLRRVAVVAGTVHKNACVQGGVAVPDHPQAIVDDVASALRERGWNATVIAPGPLAEEDAEHAPMQQLGQPPPKDLWVPNTCEELSRSLTYDVFEGGESQTLLYPATPSLAKAMSQLPFDAVLVVNVNKEESAPFAPGGFMPGSTSTPASAAVELGVQLLAKDGSVPWLATVTARGTLLHEGSFWSSFGPSQPRCGGSTGCSDLDLFD